MNDEDFYDLTRNFLEGDEHTVRPEVVSRVLESLREVAPEHARVVLEYIRRLESITEAAR